LNGLATEGAAWAESGLGDVSAEVGRALSEIAERPRESATMIDLSNVFIRKSKIRRTWKG